MKIDTEHGVDNAGWEEDTALHTLPPGEEALFLDHTGEEHELCKDLFHDPDHK